MTYTYQQITAEHGQDTTKAIKNLNKICTKITTNTCRLTFLTRCRHSGTFPRYIHDKMKIFDNLKDQHSRRKGQIEKIQTRLMKDYLNMEINVVNDQFKLHNKQREKLETTLVTLISETLFIQILDQIAKKCQNLKNAQKLKLSSKFERNRNELPNKNHFETENFCVNISGKDVPLVVQQTLGLGPKFTLPVLKEQAPIVDIVIDTDFIMDSLPESEETQHTRNMVAHDIIQYLKQPEVIKTVDKHLIDMHKKTTKFLRENPDIVVATSDKGNKTVILTKTMYHNKATEHLSDTNCYEKVRSKMKTRKVEITTNKLIKELHKNEMITKYEARNLTSENGHAPRIYMTIKTHKQGYPVRPVVSTPGSPTYKLTKFITKILSTVPINEEINIKNSISLKEKLQNVKLEEGEEFVSFDVVSLYTNISQYEAIETAMKRFPQMQTKLSREMFEKALKQCVSESNFFQYEDTLYSQKFGLAMGMATSAKLAEWVLDDLVQKLKRKFKHKIKLIYKYVDDFIIIIKREHILELFELFNSLHDTLKVTVEREFDNKINVLDMTLIRCGDLVKTKWYSKPIASGRILHYHSAHPPSVKYQTALSLTKRVLQLSEIEFQTENIGKVRNILRQNGYPEDTIKSVLRHAKYTHLSTTSNNQTTTPNEKTFKSVPYVPILGEKLAKRVNSHTDSDRQIAHKPINKLRNSFTRLKSKIQRKDIGVVYDIPCKTEGCNKRYIGETGREMKKRMREHERDFEKEVEDMDNFREELIEERLNEAANTSEIMNEVDMEIENIKCEKLFKTAAVEHQIREHHNLNFSEASVLAREPINQRRKAFEAVYIHMAGNAAINFKKDTAHIKPQSRNTINEWTYLKKTKFRFGTPCRV